ncbi:MAG: hypothetical protein H7222_07415 [Methylotenera sp.]|nr:hypothetical protein [Oligoflexia bacterium]
MLQSLGTLRGDQRGQALVEMLFALGLLLSFSVGASSVFKAKWNRTQCAYQTFEKTRAALNQDVLSSAPWAQNIRLEDQGGSIRGEGHCGDLVETVVLEKLE